MALALDVFPKLGGTKLGGEKWQEGGMVIEVCGKCEPSFE